jgi:colanic acid biosynthesis glycosyl transferase WcaI
MKILIYGLNFAPELTGIGKYTGELAAYLAAHQQDVRVVTTPPYYPQWRVADGYRWWGYRREGWQGVDVMRCPLWVPRRPSGVTRVLYLASFALSSLPVMLAQARWQPDVVFNVAPAIASTPIAWLAARLGRSRAWLHIQDFEFEAALRLKMLPGGLQGIFGLLEGRLLRGFARVSTISQRMKDRLLQKGVPPENVRLLPNWVDTDQIFPLPPAATLRAALGIAPATTVALYAGNMGKKQGLEVVVEAARQLAHRTDLLFLLCGAGAARADLEQQAAGLRQVRFLPLQPVERLNELLNTADIHLLPQQAEAADLVMPSKLSGMLASGKAVIATAHPATELAHVIAQTGLLTPPGEPTRLAQAIETLLADEPLRQRLGQQGRQFALAHWAKEKVLADFLHELTHL